MLTRYLRAGDFTPEASWNLVDWCRAQGADQFFVRFMGTAGVPAPLIDAAERDLARFAAPRSPRERAVKYLDDPALPETPLWQVTDESLVVLRRLLPNGLFTHPSYEDVGWFEEPTFYRSGEILLGIVSHEHEGFLRATAAELVSLAHAGVAFHETAEWI